MPYIFNDSIRVPTGSTFPLIDGTEIAGGFISVRTKADLDKIKTSTIRVGMLLNVFDENKIYECKEILIDYDENWEEVVVPVFKPFYVPTAGISGDDGSGVIRYRRPKKVINFSYIGEGSVVNLPIDMECKSFIVTKVNISDQRRIRLAIFGTLLRNDLNPYTFESTKRGYDTHMTTLKDGSNFQYRKFPICVNAEVAKQNQTKFVFQCTSLEKGAYTTSKGLSWNEVEATVTYIPLEAP